MSHESIFEGGTWKFAVHVAIKPTPQGTLQEGAILEVLAFAEY